MSDAVHRSTVPDNSAINQETHQLPHRGGRAQPHLGWLFVEDLRAELSARYDEAHRRYHDRRHLHEVLSAVHTLGDEADDLDAVTWAAWFHDAIYDVGADDNEERSAQLAELRLAGHLAREVARLVRLTATHKPQPGDRDGAVLCDADLHILAADEARYAEYVEDVRAEYGMVPDEEFADRRAAVLSALLEGQIFHTATGRELWEERARHNVSAEVRRLRGRG